VARNRWLALAILCTASLMVILDGTIVTVALPRIQACRGEPPTALAGPTAREPVPATCE
jgi:hypothetical protein